MATPVGYTLAPSGFYYRTDGSGPYAIDSGGTPQLASGEALEHFLRVGFGLVPGYERWSIWGNNPDIDTGTTPEVVSPGGNLSTPPFWTTPTTLEVLSSSASDVGTVLVEVLDSSYNRSMVTITLNGTSAVTFPSTAVAINTLAANVLNVGDLTVRDAGGGTTRLFVQAGRGISQSAWRTVPAGYTLQITTHLVSINRTVTAGRWATYTGVFQQFSGAAHLGAIYALDVGVSDAMAFHFKAEPGLIIREKGRYWHTCLEVSGNNTNLSSAAWGEMKSNAVY